MAVEVRRSPQQWYNLNHHRVSPSRTANSDSAVVNGGLGRGQIEVFANSPTPRVTFRAAEHQQRQAKQSASRPRVLSNNAF